MNDDGLPPPPPLVRPKQDPTEAFRASLTYAMFVADIDRLKKKCPGAKAAVEALWTDWNAGAFLEGVSTYSAPKAVLDQRLCAIRDSYEELNGSIETIRRALLKGKYGT